jgi:homopolymeric O-antigen transport system permease protein
MHSDPEGPQVVIDSSRSSLLIDWDEHLQKRDLFWFLALRDIKVRFKQAVLGATWAILKPLAMMTVFVVFLGHTMGFPTDGVPYPVFYYSGLLLWTFFSTGLAVSSDSLVGNSSLLTRVHCPILYIPAASIAAQFLDLTVAFIALIALMLYCGIWPSIRLTIVPAFILITLASTLGVGLMFAPLVAKYRDFQNLMTVLVQMWFFMSPVIYPSTAIPDRWKWLYSVNPMVGAIEGLRWAIVGQSPFPAAAVGIAVVSATCVLSVGFFFFTKSSSNLADFV